MSRPLPPHANLEHLKKQAKRLLSRTRAEQPAWVLADAQHALARGYGFASWPRLKAHIDSLQVGPAQATAPTDSGGTGSPSRRDRPPAARPHPMAGVWVANIERSTRHPAYPFRSARLQIDVDGDRLTLTQAVVDPSGLDVGGTMTMVADGQDHPTDPGGGHLLNARWTTDLVLEAIDKKDGAEAGRGIYELAADGRQLTVSTAEQRIVFDRA